MSTPSGPSDGSDRSDSDEQSRGTNLYHNYSEDDLRIICTGDGDILYWDDTDGPESWISMEDALLVRHWC